MDLKEKVGTLVIIMGAVEVLALLIYGGIRRHIGNPLNHRRVARLTIFICIVTVLGAIIAPVVVAAQH